MGLSFGAFRRIDVGFGEVRHSKDRFRCSDRASDGSCFYLCMDDGVCFRIRVFPWKNGRKHLCVSGSLRLATGASWICYFKALSVGEVNKVAAVDKSSTVLTVIFAVLILGETEHLLFRLFCIVLIGGGTLLMIEKAARVSRGEPEKLAFLCRPFGSVCRIDFNFIENRYRRN